MKNFWSISLIVVLLASCATENKANKFFQEHPEKLAQKCAIAFPVKDSSIVKDSISFDTLYLPGEPIVLKDSFFVKGDTIVKIVTKQCPQLTTLIKTIRHDSIVYRRNTAYEATLQYQIKDLQRLVSDYLQTIQDQNKKLKADQSNIATKRKHIFWLVVLCIGEALVIFRKPLLKVFA